MAQARNIYSVAMLLCFLCYLPGSFAHRKQMEVTAEKVTSFPASSARLLEFYSKKLELRQVKLHGFLLLSYTLSFTLV